jgi:hypothetical protein
MDALEQLVRDRLDAHAGTGEVPHDFALRAVTGAAARRRRRRATGLAASAAALVVVLVAGGAAALLDPAPADPAGLQDAPDPSATLPSVAPSPSTELESVESMLGTAGTTVANRDGEWWLTVNSLSADGTLYGIERTFDDETGMDVEFGELWARDLVSGEVATTMEPAASSWFHTADRQIALSMEHVDPQNQFDLFCVDRATGERTRLSATSVGETTPHTDDGRIVWSTYPEDPTGTGPAPVWVSDCDGPAERLQVEGWVAALSWPHVYVQDQVDAPLRRFDATTGVVETVVIPDGVPSPQSPQAQPQLLDVFVAGDTMTWVVDGQLVVLDLAAGTARVVARDLPVVYGHNGTTIQVGYGDRYVAYSTVPVDGLPSEGRGVLVDTVTGRVADTGGPAWAAGPWVVWQSADGFHVVRAD